MAITASTFRERSGSKISPDSEKGGRTGVQINRNKAHGEDHTATVSECSLSSYSWRKKM